MNNGHESNLEERMQRAERIIAGLAKIQDETQSELRTLAKSQVFMTETMGKVGVRLDELGQRMKEVGGWMIAWDERMIAWDERMNAWDVRMNELGEKINEIAQAQLAGDERLNALIDYFRRHLEEHGQQ